MLIELTSTKTVEGVGFKLENAQIDGIRIVEILDPSLVKLRIGDVLLSLCGVGLRGLSFADVKAKLDALTNGATFDFSVGRKPTETDLRDYGGPTKEDLRKKIWDKLEKDDIADFPRPCHHRIPNFKGVDSGQHCDEPSRDLPKQSYTTRYSCLSDTLYSRNLSSPPPPLSSCARFQVPKERATGCCPYPPSPQPKPSKSTQTNLSSMRGI